MLDSKGHRQVSSTLLKTRARCLNQGCRCLRQAISPSKAHSSSLPVDNLNLGTKLLQANMSHNLAYSLLILSCNPFLLDNHTCLLASNPYKLDINPYLQDINPQILGNNPYLLDKNPYPLENNSYHLDNKPCILDIIITHMLDNMLIQGSPHSLMGIRFQAISSKHLQFHEYQALIS